MPNPKYAKNRWSALHRPIIDLRAFVDAELVNIDLLAEVPRVSNDEDKALMRADRLAQLRRYCNKFVSFAIPTDDALDLIASHGPLLEVGAGNGYWAWRLRERGVNVIAAEPDSDKPNGMLATLRANQRVVLDYPKRALLMVWPTKGDDWAADAVDLYEGNTVIIVGDLHFRETGTPAIATILELKGYTPEHPRALDSWPGVFRDYVMVFKR